MLRPVALGSKPSGTDLLGFRPALLVAIANVEENPRTIGVGRRRSGRKKGRDNVVAVGGVTRGENLGGFGGLQQLNLDFESRESEAFIAKRLQGRPAGGEGKCRSHEYMRTDQITPKFRFHTTVPGSTTLAYLSKMPQNAPPPKIRISPHHHHHHYAQAVPRVTGRGTEPKNRACRCHAEQARPAEGPVNVATKTSITAPPNSPFSGR
jgi:hypothetical protein